MDDLDAIAADILRKGLARADELEAKAAQLRASLADPVFVRARAEAQVRARQNAAWWEAEESFPADAANTIWAGTATDLATGQGVTSHSLVAYARSEGEFRRKFGRRTTPQLADAVTIDESARAWAEQRWSADSRPAAMSFFIESHVNYS